MPTFASQTPLHIGMVGLKVRDLDRVLGFYRDAIGLAQLSRRNGTATLGAGGVPLVELTHDPASRPDDPHTAGLFHTAFLMPTRADLARWLVHAAEKRVPLTGASDHSVSEAIYLDDPEGNGIEVYRDRAPEEWSWERKFVRMTTEALDLDDLAGEAAASDARYAGAPADLCIGHIHLRVGDLDRAEKFYLGGVGLDLTRERHGAAFMSSGRYHHHVGANVWHSAGAGKREEGRAGLDWFSFEAADADAFARVNAGLAAAGAPVKQTDRGTETADPWGTRIRVTKRA
jgi:catechol 2,3-dioxygenase